MSRLAEIHWYEAYGIASANGLIRVVDESGEDYAFSATRFYPIEVPKPVEQVLLSANFS